MILKDGDTNLKTINDLADNVYVLNLEDELFKYEILARKLSKKNIKHERFIGTGNQDNEISLLEQFQMHASAVTKYKHSDIINPMIRNAAKNICFNLGAYRSPGAAGCRISNMRIMEDAIKNNYESIVIFQDDVYFHNEFDTLLADHYEEIQRSDIFYLGATEHSPQIKKNKWANPNWNYTKNKKDADDRLKYRPTGKTYGQFAVYMHKNVFQEQLDLLRLKCFADDQCLNIVSSGKSGRFRQSSWVAYPNLVIADMSFSGTFNHTHEDDKSHRDIDTWLEVFGWDVEYYDLEEKYYT